MNIRLLKGVWNVFIIDEYRGNQGMIDILEDIEFHEIYLEGLHMRLNYLIEDACFDPWEEFKK